jgi:hypothetical protein
VSRLDAAALCQALDAIRRAQLRTGEIPAFRRAPEGGPPQYLRTLLSTTLVHDALGCFDPRSPWWEERALHPVPEAARGWFVGTAAHVRRRARAFIAWQAEPNGTWRFFGRASGLPPDACTVACAAAALLESPGRTAWERSRRHVEAIARFRSEDGPYHTFAGAHRAAGYGWMDEAGRPLPGFDRVVNAEVLRFLALAGACSAGEVAALTAYLRGELAAAGPSPLFPNPLCFAFAMARAWRQAQLPDPDGLRSELVPLVRSRQDGSGGFGGPLSTALACAALSWLDHEGPELERGLDSVARERRPGAGWAYEDFVAGGYGSPAWTAALSLAVSARAGAPEEALVP